MKVREPEPIPEEQAEVFFNTLADGCHIGRACAAAGLPRMRVWRERNRNPEFAMRWKEAMEIGVSKLEDLAHERAFEGIDEPLSDKGLLTGDCVKKYSDTLAIFMLKAHAPEKYRENTRMELTGANGGPVEFTDLQLAARMAAIMSAKPAADDGVPTGEDGEPLL